MRFDFFSFEPGIPEIRIWTVDFRLDRKLNFGGLKSEIQIQISEAKRGVRPSEIWILGWTKN
jgi:hypothetical protein